MEERRERRGRKEERCVYKKKREIGRKGGKKGGQICIKHI